MDSHPPEEDGPAEAITGLLRAAESGDHTALDQLFGRVYAELHKLARRQLQATPVQATLSTTALVHEAYLKLSGDASRLTRE